MVFWKRSQPTQAARATPNSGMDHSDEIIAEDVEEPDERQQWTPLKMNDTYTKTRPTESMFNRRESLLTRQLHSETEHSDEDHTHRPPRTLSTQSTWSNPSVASTAELTSDDGRSMPSPAMSPPLLPTHAYGTVPVHETALDQHVKIVGQDNALQSEPGAEKSVEATLGRKRCIMFACRGKEETKAKEKAPSPAPPPAPVQVTATPPKRKCAIKFNCPMRGSGTTKSAESTPAKRPMSPPPPERKPSALSVGMANKTHRGSDSTVTHVSPKNVRKSPTIITTAPTPIATDLPRPLAGRESSNALDEAGAEAMRFHEFASSDDEPEEWMKESSCHRSRLTIDDTLKKEIDIRKVCEEVDEEALEEDDDEEADVDEADEVGVLDDEDEAEEEANEDDDEDDDEEEEEDEDESDDGFHSDDEHGFAASDSEGEDSDYEWWKPGGSTAATSTDQLDRLSISHKSDDKVVASSLNSMSSGQLSPRPTKRPSYRRHRNQGTSRSIAIPNDNQADVANDELPDSTDFVCGTLDEDRPLEQAYLTRKTAIEAAKHKARPQDIDPTFPTSDPEMDEEDDEDLEDPEESEQEENMMHGSMDEMHHEGSTLKRRPSPHRRTTHRSPPPPARHPSPAPRRCSKHYSPPPPTRRLTTKSPPPQRKLFGQSPRRGKSPAPHHRMTSPPNSRISSPTAAHAFKHSSKALAERPQLTHTASLPRGGFLLSRLGESIQEDPEDADATRTTEVPKRGAIDIVKGLEKKRQRRREKMHQKLCAKAAAKGEKTYKVKPGKGCERMREVGLQLQEYHGKAQHILSL
ncbi:hypothetical protein LTR97_010378 [Elasticomyces elasticus]|uniref:Extensin domain-containing protein n=1 Tax=Elasticomyces elasticus TaxID=574655 RepID=A0AAN7VNF4_9PEZI|nr:hypothetical protein LTR97_010378 [Elasticomyces elasticus]